MRFPYCRSSDASLTAKRAVQQDCAHIINALSIKMSSDADILIRFVRHLEQARTIGDAVLKHQIHRAGGDPRSYALLIIACLTAAASSSSGAAAAIGFDGAAKRCTRARPAIVMDWEDVS
jgi:hypothetical protein